MLDPQLQIVMALGPLVCALCYVGMSVRNAKRELPRSRRRRFMLGLVFAVLVCALALHSVGWFGGASARHGVTSPESLSTEARALLEDVLGDIDPERRFDYHTHLAGVGNGTECWVNPRMRSVLYPKDFARFVVYASAAGISSPNAPDTEFADRLAELVSAQSIPGKHLLLAFDHRYTESGEKDLEGSEFHVPNDYVWETCARYPDLFVPCVSVHPYRADALSELTHWAERGVKFVKWLPNAMGIDPASPRCDPIYAVMAQHEMVLLTHSGEEQAVEAEADQRLGNPLRLRRPLDAGVKVIAAHCASSGEGEDLDAPVDSSIDSPGKTRPNLELFLRLMEEERYEGLLFGEISTITQVNRYGGALRTLLERTDLHHRFVNGSDYPLPAINVLYLTYPLVRAGLLDPEHRPLLAELYDFDPLLFDLALKRLVRGPEGGERFPASVFETHPALLPQGR